MVVQPLDSTENKLVRSVRRLLTSRSARDKSGQAVVEGPHLLQEAVKGGAELVTVLYSPRLVSDDEGRSLVVQLSAHRARLLYVTDAVIDSVSDVLHHQGVLAVIRYRVAEARQLPLPAQGPALAVVTDAIQDPGNLGTLIRTAQAAGAHAVGTTKGTVDVLNPKTLRASAGSVFQLPVVSLQEGWLAEAKAQGLAVRAAVVNGGTEYDRVDWCLPTLLVLGNEGQGLSGGVLEAAERVSIPMAPWANSLNVTMAGAVILFQAALQRRRRGLLLSPPVWYDGP